MAKTSNEKNNDTGRSRFVKCLLPVILSAVIVGGGFFSFYRAEIREYKNQNQKLQEKLDVYQGKNDLLMDHIAILEDSIRTINYKIDSIKVIDSAVINRFKQEIRIYEKKLSALDNFTDSQHYRFFTRYLDTARVRE